MCVYCIQAQQEMCFHEGASEGSNCCESDYMYCGVRNRRSVCTLTLNQTLQNPFPQSLVSVGVSKSCEISLFLLHSGTNVHGLQSYNQGFIKFCKPDGIMQTAPISNAQEITMNCVTYDMFCMIASELITELRRCLMQQRIETCKSAVERKPAIILSGYDNRSSCVPWKYCPEKI